MALPWSQDRCDLYDYRFFRNVSCVLPDLLTVWFLMFFFFGSLTRFQSPLPVSYSNLIVLHSVISIYLDSLRFTTYHLLQSFWHALAFNSSSIVQRTFHHLYSVPLQINPFLVCNYSKSRRRITVSNVVTLVTWHQCSEYVRQLLIALRLLSVHSDVYPKYPDDE